jgi:hypothetical protein
MPARRKPQTLESPPVLPEAEGITHTNKFHDLPEDLREFGIVPDPGRPLTDYEKQERAVEALQRELVGDGALASASIVINKKNEAGIPEYLEKVSAQDVAGGVMEYVAQYGPGTYTLVIYAGGGTGISARHTVRVSDIAGERALEKARERKAKLHGGALAVAGPSPEILELREMMKGLALTVSELAKPKPQDSLVERLREITAVQQAFGIGAAAPAAQPQMDMFKFMSQMLGFMRDMQPPAEGDLVGTLGRGLEKLAPIFQMVMQANAQQQPPVRISPPAQPAGVAPPQPPGAQSAVAAAAPNPPAANQGEENEAMFVNQMIGFFLGMCVDAAIKQQDPYPYACMIQDKAPPHVLAEWAAVETPALLEKLKELDPRVIHYAEWFAQLHAEVRKVMAEAAEADAAEG